MNILKLLNIFSGKQQLKTDVKLRKKTKKNWIKKWEKTMYFNEILFLLLKKENIKIIKNSGTIGS